MVLPKRIIVPESRNNNDLRQKIWALFVVPWGNNTRVPGQITRIFYHNLQAVRVRPSPNFPTGTDIGTVPENVIDITSPGSLTTIDIRIVWLLTMLDSSYYNLLDRARRYVHYFDIPMDNILIVEIVPADFHLLPQI